MFGTPKREEVCRERSLGAVGVRQILFRITALRPASPA
jgi:hypothetical protein